MSICKNKVNSNHCSKHVKLIQKVILKTIKCPKDILKECLHNLKLISQRVPKHNNKHNP